MDDVELLRSIARGDLNLVIDEAELTLSNHVVRV
jgi:hypothetical protein